MQIDRKILEEFKRLYEEEFNEKIDDKEAFERFSRVVNALRIIYYPESTSHLNIPIGECAIIKGEDEEGNTLL